MQQLLPLLQLKFWRTDGSNLPLSLGKVYCYYSGTTDFAPTYQNEGGAENTNPVILDINGEAQIWLSPEIVYDIVVTDSNDDTQLTRENVSVSGGSGGTSGDYIKRVTNAGIIQSINTDIRTNKVTGLITRTSTFEMRDGIMLLTNKITAPANDLTIPGGNKSQIVLDSNITATVDTEINAVKTGINPPKVTISENILAKDVEASLVKVFDAPNDEFTIYDTVHGEADRYARLSDVTGVIGSVADTATIDLNIDGSKVLTADVKDGSITLSKLDTTSVDTRYLPKNFTSPQILDWAGVSRFTFTGSGNFVSVDLGTNQAIALLPNARNVKFNDHNLIAPPSVGPEYTWDLPSASGTLALDSSLGNYVLKSGDTMSGPLSIIRNTGGVQLTVDSGTQDIAYIRSKGVSNTTGWSFGAGSSGWFSVRNEDTGTTTFQISRTTNNATFTNRVTAGALTSNGDLSVATTSTFNGNNTHNTTSDTRSTYNVNGVGTGLIQAVANNFRISAIAGSDLQFFTNGSSRGFIANSNNQWNFLTQINGTSGVFSGVVTASPRFDANGLNSDSRGLRILTSGVQRWLLRANTDSESGSDAGSNFALTAYDDAGNTIDSPITIARAASGNITFTRNLNATTATFSGLVSASTAPTLGQHLTNKTYVDTQVATKENVITAGTTSQYWRGDKTWQTLNTSVVTEGTNLYYTDARARLAISLTTTGSSGASTYNNVSGVLNIPNYTLAGLGGQPLNSNLTELSTLSGSSGLIRRTGSTYVYDNAAYITASALADYVAKTGDTMSGTLNNTATGTTLNIGNTVSYANMPTTAWSYKLGTSSSGSVDDGALARWTNRVSGTNATGYVLRWLSESRSGGSLGAEVERMSLTNSGLTVAGTVTASIRFDANGLNTDNRGLRILTSGVQRWLLRANTDTESGSNAGSNFALTAYDDAGNTIDSPITITRASGGAIVLNRPLTGTTFTSTSTTPITIASVATGTVASGGWLGINGSGQIVKASAPNPFNQNLNTTDSVTFNNLTLSGSATIGGATITGALSANSGTFGGDVILQASGVTRGAIGLNSGNTVIKSYNGSGTLIDNPITITNSTGGLITSTRPLQINDYARINTSLTLGDGTSSLSGDFTQFKPAGAISNYQIRGIYSGASSAGVLEVIANNASDNLTSYGIRSGASAFGSPELYTWDITTNNVYFPAKVSLARSTAASAGFNIDAFGVTVTSPVDGDVWKSATDSLAVRMGSNTRTVTFNEKSQTFSGTQTFNLITATNTITGRQLAQTRQTSATSTGSITWTLSSGGQMDLTTTLTGSVTMNITAPSAGGYSNLYVTQGATPQTVVLSLTGVSWILTGANGTTGTNTITIPTAAFYANKSSCITLYWSTATRCYVSVT